MDCLTLSSNTLHGAVMDRHPEGYAMKWSLWQAGITLETKQRLHGMFNICIFENLELIPFDIKRPPLLGMIKF